MARLWLQLWHQLSHIFARWNQTVSAASAMNALKLYFVTMYLCSFQMETRFKRPLINQYMKENHYKSKPRFFHYVMKGKILSSKPLLNLLLPIITIQRLPQCFRNFRKCICAIQNKHRNTSAGCNEVTVLFKFKFNETWCSTSLYWDTAPPTGQMTTLQVSTAGVKINQMWLCFCG